ncbi:MAG TPA: VOC family protein [Thermoanaerobaculia bacterium]
MKWTRSDPVYPVADVAAAIDWYTRVLGFAVTLVNPPGEQVPVYAILRRDAVSIHLLRKGDAPFGLTGPVQAQLWIDGGLDELFQRAKEMGAEILEAPCDRPWGHREFMIADLDRNVVWVTMPVPGNAG